MKKCSQKINGFSLIELMIVIAIVAILASIGYPSYQQYVIKSQRSVAISVVMDIAARQNQYFSNNKRYTANLADLGLPSPYYVDENGPSTAAEGLYQMAVTAPTTLTFTITATAINNMTKDTECGNYGLNEIGTKSETGTLDVKDCW